MGKANHEKKARSVGSEIIEALHNAVAYAKGDHSKGRTHRIPLPQRINFKRVRRRSNEF